MREAGEGCPQVMSPQGTEEAWGDGESISRAGKPVQSVDEGTLPVSFLTVRV